MAERGLSGLGLVRRAARRSCLRPPFTETKMKVDEILTFPVQSTRKGGNGPVPAAMIGTKLVDLIEASPETWLQDCE